MKRFLAILMVAGVLFVAVPVKAQALPLEEQYRQALLMMIALLTEQVKILQRQLAVLEAQQSISHPFEPAVRQVGVPLASRSISLVLDAVARRTLNPNTGKGVDIFPNGKTIILTNGGGWRDDQLRILVNVGGRTDLTCERSGNWSGAIESMDQWIVVGRAQEGKYIVTCRDEHDVAEDYIVVQTTK